MMRGRGGDFGPDFGGEFGPGFGGEFCPCFGGDRGPSDHLTRRGSVLEPPRAAPSTRPETTRVTSASVGTRLSLIHI